MKSGTMLSIVTISYRDPKGLEKTLASVQPLLQSALSWEHIVVDSSPELNHELISRYAAQPNFVHLKEPAKGIYSAMNAGFRATRGNFIWFLNSGDMLSSPSALFHAVDRLNQNQGASQIWLTADLFRDGNYLYSQNPRPGIWPMLGINRICHQALIYRRELLESLGGFTESYRLAADYELHLRAIAKGATTIFLPEPLVSYDMSGQSSDPASVFEEFKAVHHSLAAKGQLSFAWLHALVRKGEWVRIFVFKALGKSFMGPQLRAAWAFLKRRA